MKRYILDTGIASDFVCRRYDVDKRAKHLLAEGHRIGICWPVLCELFAGLELSSTRDRNEHRLRTAIKPLNVWPVDERSAREFGILFATLRRAGRPMQQIDIQIAAIAKTLPSCIVVTKDSDFGAIPGLLIENWAAR